MGNSLSRLAMLLALMLAMLPIDVGAQSSPDGEASGGIGYGDTQALIARRGRKKRKRKRPTAPEPPPVPVEPPPPVPEDVSATETEVAGSEDTTAVEVDSSEEETEEELVDFEEEEAELDRQSQQMIAAAGGGGGGTSGFKIFVDMLLDYRVGQETVTFRPNHTYILVQAELKDTGSVTVHVSDAPAYWELTWNVTPTLSVKGGKILVPFGTNDFHHLIGGRVDEQSHFLPQTWGDYGIALNHLLYDGDNFNIEYDAWVVNGFEGVDEPLIADGNETDNNFAKGIGTRVKLGLLGNIVVTGSAYFDMWDADNKYKLLFYAAGVELRPGLIPVPGLRRLRLRGEWGRGEIELPSNNNQTGILKHAFARAGYYGEATYPITDSMIARVRVGRINPRNILPHDEGDVDVWEPALLVGTGKLIFTFAYQMVARVGKPYKTDSPADVAYAKFFLQF